VFLPVGDVVPDMPMRPSVFVLYSANLIPPSWIHVYKSIEPTSRRTQAAAIAYMFPHHINMMKIRVHLRVVTALRRRIKLDTCLECVRVPPISSQRQMMHSRNQLSYVMGEPTINSPNPLLEIR